MTRAIAILSLLLLACGSSSSPPPDVSTAVGALSSTCATCSTVTPQHTVILVHGRNDTPARWNALVTKTP